MGGLLLYTISWFYRAKNGHRTPDNDTRRCQKKEKKGSCINIFENNRQQEKSAETIDDMRHAPCFEGGPEAGGGGGLFFLT